ncbi:MAG: translation initiation factor IF-2 [Clostridia bacterium]|nr:translation initiation factor IF-2 [Clostridia bacterium]
MAENKAMHIENLKQANELIKGGLLEELVKSTAKIEVDVKSAKSALEEKLKALTKIRKEKEAAEKEKEALIAVEKEKEKEVIPAPIVEEPVVEKPEPKKKRTKKAVEESAPVVEEKTEKPEVVETAPVVQEKVEVQPEEKPEQKAEEKKEEKKEFIPSFIVRREGPIKRPEKKTEERRPRTEFRPSERPPRGERPQGQGARERGPKPEFNKTGAPKKPNATFVAPPIVNKTDNRNFSKKKQGGEGKYEDKRALNKRALIKNQVDVDDFDENKSGYRKFRPVKKAKEKSEVNVIKIEKAVINTEIIPLKVLSEKIGITAAEITKRLFKEGIMKTINDSIDFDTAAFIADDIGVELELKLDKTAEDVLSEGFEGAPDDANLLVKRPPVVTVMGHVDHGKTSILDRIRKSNVTAGEAGGITQHIGAYQVTAGGEVITFLDTPGHAAFTAMRARGAQATDIAILVVAADDGIMPQTVEAINHAKAADVPILVAVNKIDKPEANIERVKTQLTEHGLLPEEWGGDAILCPVSAKTGEGFDNLLENINLLAEIKDLKANPDRKAKGVVIEAKLDQSKGPIATVLIQNGTLKVGESVIVGTVTGKIRAMVDDKGRRVANAGPSMPVSIMGLDDVPNSGDILYAVEHEKLAKLVAEERQNKEKENMMKAASKVTLDDVFNKIAEGEMKILPLIVKADVQGSVEAVKSSLEKLSNAEVKVNVIHAAAGAIKESDIMLAESSGAIIIGFNVRPDSNAKQIAERSGVDVKLYRVIYEAIEDVERALKGMLAPKFTEVYMGKAEVREVFKISGVGQVAGCYVTEGKIIRNGKLRIYRDDVMICEGNVNQLKRFKDDVKEVAQGYECGISIERFNDIKVGDFIESYQVEENKD